MGNGPIEHHCRHIYIIIDGSESRRENMQSDCLNDEIIVITAVHFIPPIQKADQMIRQGTVEKVVRESRKQNLENEVHRLNNYARYAKSS